MIVSRTKGLPASQLADFLLFSPEQVVTSAECTDDKQKELWVVYIFPVHLSARQGQQDASLSSQSV